MTGLNHSTTGALISTVLPLPIALPAAFLSHFVLDSLPHFGEVFEKRQKLSKTIWVVDITFTLLFMTFLVSQENWAALLCAFAAISPDLAWVYRFVFSEKFGTRPPKPTNKFNRLHESIQKFETRWGLIVEVVWLGVVLGLLRNQL